MYRFDPARADFSPYGLSCVRWTAATMARGDRHNEVEINLLERGSLVYLLGGRKVPVVAGRLTVFWAGIPHQVVHVERLSEYFVLTIPLGRFLQWRLPEHFTHAILNGAMVAEPDARQLPSDLARMELWSDDLRSNHELRRQASLLEIEARLRRLAHICPTEPPRPPRRRSPATLDPQTLSRAEAMALFIARSYADPLTAQAIGEHVGLHPNYAMALFQRTFGTTLIKYVTEHRLSHAQRLLVTTDDAILDIAFRSGFGSLSRFNEAFRQSFRCTPREYRKRYQLA